MEIGKVPNDLLRKLVIDKINKKREEVILSPKIGEDCSGVDFGENVCVLSTDPITGASNEVGRLAVHVSCNDIASCGARPIGLMVTILAPPQATENDLETIMTQICQTADSLNVDIIGGHTEVTNAVNRFVITTTAVGKTLKDRLVTTSGCKVGDSIIITKSAGIEGTAIIANEKEDELISHFGKEFVCRAKSYIDKISVVNEGIIAGAFGVNSMHDVTEGGILGALWEVAEASEVGMEINYEDVPIQEETKRISEFYNINPLKLISSGSMIITCQDGYGLLGEFKKNGIDAAVIGKVTAEKRKCLYINNKVELINQPEPDELYKVV